MVRTLAKMQAQGMTPEEELEYYLYLLSIILRINQNTLFRRQESPLT